MLMLLLGISECSYRRHSAAEHHGSFRRGWKFFNDRHPSPAEHDDATESRNSQKTFSFVSPVKSTEVQKESEYCGI